MKRFVIAMSILVFASLTVAALPADVEDDSSKTTVKEKKLLRPRRRTRRRVRDANAVPEPNESEIMAKIPEPLHKEFKRVGKDGRIFTLWKFRSMRQNAEENGAVWATKGDDRVTRAGRWIRLLRIDEIPQLYNVFRGEMSMIGPRPERPEFVRELEKQIPYYNIRHAVRPGITGWAQVNYRYGASVKDALRKLEYDLYYIKNRSLLLDIKIILKTIGVVLFGQGAR